MYSDSGSGAGIFFLIIGFVFAVLYVWATIVVIIAGHRYLDRTKPAQRPDQPQH